MNIRDRNISIVQDPPFQINHIHIKYDKNITLKIYIIHFEHIQQFNKDMDWDLRLLKKEIISIISIYCDDKLIQTFK